MKENNNDEDECARKKEGDDDEEEEEKKLMFRGCKNTQECNKRAQRLDAQGGR